MNRTLSVLFGKSSTSSAVEMTSLPGGMSTAEVKSQKKRKRRKIESGTPSDGDIEWAKSLSECQLDLMVSVKQLAVERVWSTREKSLHGLLIPTGLRAIGIILEEFMMDRVQTLRNASTAPSLVIGDLRACIEESEVETNETKETNQDKIVIETDEGSLQHPKVRVCFSSHAWKVCLVCTILDLKEELQHIVGLFECV